MSDRFNEDFLISDPDYASVLNGAVIPELEKLQENRMIPGKDQLPLFCSVFRAVHSRGTVLVLHGFTENAYKYSELIFSLVRNCFSVVAYDQRGHGRSGRVSGLSHPSVTHVDRFDDYVDDLDIVCDTLLPDLPKPWMIFAHSMGGAVASLFLERHHDVFSAAAFCAPMIAPATGGIPPAAAAALCRFYCSIGRGKDYPFFMKPYSGPENFKTSCATDPSRFSWYDQVKTSRTDFQNSVPSYRWTVESLAVTRRILAAGAPESVTCPVLLSTADHDYSVIPGPQREFIDRVPKGRHLFVPESRHEIFRSVNSVFFPWWHTVLSFLKEAEL